MPASPLQKLVLAPIVVSATVFAVLTLPLAILGSKPVTIQFQKEAPFKGQLKDVAAPYLVLASVLSLGAGLASVAITGWQRSTRKSSQVEAQLSDLAKNLQEKEAQLEALKVSQSRLEASGLSAFLDEQVTLEQVQPIQPLNMDEKPVVEPLVITTQPFEAQPQVQSQRTVQAAAARFATAQTFLGYTQPKTPLQPTPVETPLALSQVQELHTKLEQIKAQMATLQTALSANSQAQMLEVSTEENTETPNNPPRLQVVQSWNKIIS